MEKKGQYAVPIILLAFAALFLAYLILVYPEERQKLLGTNKTEEIINESPLGENTVLIFSSGKVIEVGTTYGEVVFDFGLEDVYLNYPTSQRTIDKLENVELKASILSSNQITLNANNINLNSTKEVILKFNVTEIKGNAKIAIYRNQTLLFERTVQTGENEVKVPKSILNENFNPIVVKLIHQSPFWQTQKIILSEISIIQEYYNPVKPTDEQVLYISENNYQGNKLRIEFNATKISDEGKLILNINGKNVWSGRPNLGKNYIMIELSKSNIIIGENVIRFEAEKGGEFNLTNIRISFIAAPTPSAEQTYSFDVEKEYLESNRSIVIGIRVDKIIKPGQLFAKIEPYDLYYYFSEEEIAAGAWSYVEINKEVLKQFGNKITISSPTGRFKISGFVVVLV